MTAAQRLITWRPVLRRLLLLVSAMAVLPLLVVIVMLLVVPLALTGWFSDAQIQIILLLGVISGVVLLILGLRAIFEYLNASQRAIVVAGELDDALGNRRSSDVGWEQEVEIVAGQGEIGSLQSLIHHMEVSHELLREWLAYREETESMGVSDTIDGAFTTDAFSDLLRPGLEQGLREAEVEFIMMSAVTELAMYERFRTSHPKLPAIPVADIMMDETERQLSLEDLVSLTEWSHTLALMTALPLDLGFGKYGDTTEEFLSGEMSRNVLDPLSEHVHRAITLTSEINHIQEHSDIEVIEKSEIEDLRLVNLQSLEGRLEKLYEEVDLTWDSTDIEQIEPVRFKQLVRMWIDTYRFEDWEIIEAADVDEMDDALGGFGIDRKSHIWIVPSFDSSTFPKALARFITYQRTRPKYDAMVVFAPWVLVDGAKFNTIDGVDHVYDARTLADQGVFDGISRSEFGIGVPPFTPPTARELYRDELGET